MPSSDKVFTVMWRWTTRDLYRKMGCPEVLPWAFIEPHEKQAMANHSQTLQRLNERGGLDIVEIRAVLEGKSWNAVSSDEASAIRKLVDLLHNWEKEHASPTTKLCPLCNAEMEQDILPTGLPGSFRDVLWCTNKAACGYWVPCNRMGEVPRLSVREVERQVDE